MILVVNLNASVDKRYKLTKLVNGTVMRAFSVDNTPGGKGLHVANVATILGEDCLVTGLLGGKSGEFIEERLKDYGISHDFVPVKGETRSCLAFLTDDGEQTEVLEPGPEITQEEQQEFYKKYGELLKRADVIVASGSAPRGFYKDVYAKMIEAAGDKPFLLDTSGELLREGIKAAPYFIKPNSDEIASLSGMQIKSEEDVIQQIRSFLKQGIKLATVSLGASGSIAGFEDKIYRVTVPKIEAKNPVGSGDSYVAGVAVGLHRKLSIEESLRLGAACGTANAMEDESGFVQKKVVQELLPSIKVELL